MTEDTHIPDDIGKLNPIQNKTFCGIYVRLRFIAAHADRATCPECKRLWDEYNNEPLPSWATKEQS